MAKWYRLFPSRRAFWQKPKTRRMPRGLRERLAALEMDDAEGRTPPMFPARLRRSGEQGFVRREFERERVSRRAEMRVRAPIHRAQPGLIGARIAPGSSRAASRSAAR